MASIATRVWFLESRFASASSAIYTNFSYSEGPLRHYGQKQKADCSSRSNWAFDAAINLVPQEAGLEIVIHLFDC